MTISEAIKRLEEIKEEHGDLPVFIKDECADYNLLIDTVPSLEEFLPSNDLDLDDDNNWLQCVIFKEF